MSTLRSYHRISPISDKARSRQDARAACIRAVGLRAKHRCEAKVPGICTGGHDHTHELVKRSAGGSITDPKNCIAICRACHRWTHDHPAEAFERGLLRSPKQEAKSWLTSSATTKDHSSKTTESKTSDSPTSPAK